MFFSCYTFVYVFVVFPWKDCYPDLIIHLMYMMNLDSGVLYVLLWLWPPRLSILILLTVYAFSFSEALYITDRCLLFIGSSILATR